MKRGTSPRGSVIERRVRGFFIHMVRFLGVDHGTKRIGLAISDPDAELASPLATVEVGGGAAAQARAVLERAGGYDVDEIVVGLPLNADDSEGRQAKISRAFGAELSRVAGLPMHYWDERHSTLTARELLIPAALTRKKRKARLDRVAAQVMLQSFLDARRDTRNPESR